MSMIGIRRADIICHSILETEGGHEIIHSSSNGSDDGDCGWLCNEHREAVGSGTRFELEGCYSNAH